MAFAQVDGLGKHCSARHSKAGLPVLLLSPIPFLLPLPFQAFLSALPLAAADHVTGAHLSCSRLALRPVA